MSVNEVVADFLEHTRASMICVGRKESHAQERPRVKEQKSQGTQTHTETHQKSLLAAGAGRHRKNPHTHRFPKECGPATLTWDLRPPQL